MHQRHFVFMPVRDKAPKAENLLKSNPLSKDLTELKRGEIYPNNARLNCRSLRALEARHGDKFWLASLRSTGWIIAN